MLDDVTPARSVYVSITGLELKRKRHTFRFLWHALRAVRQARHARGILKAELNTINGVRHTLTVWESEADMRRFLYQGAHRAAIRVFPNIATGKTFGFTTTEVPGLDDVHALWHERGRDYAPPNMRDDRGA